MKLVSDEEWKEEETLKNSFLTTLKNDEKVMKTKLTSYIDDEPKVLGFKDQSAVMWTNLTYFFCILLALVFIFKYFSK
jgi:hypothetical protein